MDLRFQVSDACITEYQTLRMGHNHRFIIYKTVDNSRFEIEKIGKRDETFTDFVGSLPQDGARFCVFDYHMVFPDGRTTDKIVYVFWCPGGTSVKVKMIAAATNQYFQNQLQGIAFSVQAMDFSELDQSEIERRIR